jgi:hypothetical protein
MFATGRLFGSALRASVRSTTTGTLHVLAIFIVYVYMRIDEHVYTENCFIIATVGQKLFSGLSVLCLQHYHW